MTAILGLAVTLAQIDRCLGPKLARSLKANASPLRPPVNEIRGGNPR